MRVVLILIVLFSSLSSLADNPPEEASSKRITIVASIRPLALIARDVAGDLADVETLVPSGASHHDYSMRISDRRRLDTAQLVLWMGPTMERFLEKPLANVESERLLTLGREHETVAHQHHDHSHERDLHQWLVPRLAADMAEAIGVRLQELLPQHQLVLADRVKEVVERYEALDRSIQQTFEPLKSTGFVVEHRGYDLLVEAYGLNQLGWISEHPEQSPSVRHLYQLEQNIRRQPEAEKARCLFNERAHQSSSVVNLARQLGLHLRSLDILGDEADTYSALMQNLAADMANCLSRA